MDKLPVSIISPVRNCVGEMQAHARHLRELSHVVAEIIVVDSDSSDGTMAYLQNELRDTGAVFLNHPPGLYPSWNHGISHARQPYLTVATVGDNLPPSSLATLYEDLEKYDCDVVVTAPALLNPDGSPSGSRWPVHRLIEASGMTAPRRISQAVWLALALGFFPKSLLASSSGNLYRTVVFKDHPFPTDCGHRGDVIWAITSARRVRWMIDPTVESCFKFNARPSVRRLPGDDVIMNWSRVVMEALERERAFMREEGVPDWFLTELGGMLECAMDSLSLGKAYAATRSGILPWFLNPVAIRQRALRKRLKKQSASDGDLLRRYMKTIGDGDAACL